MQTQLNATAAARADRDQAAMNSTTLDIAAADLRLFALTAGHLRLTRLVTRRWRARSGRSLAWPAHGHDQARRRHRSRDRALTLAPPSSDHDLGPADISRIAARRAPSSLGLAR
jgi:hypothetical protein